MTNFYVGAIVQATGIEASHGVGEIVQMLDSGTRAIVHFPDSPHGEDDGVPDGAFGQKAGWCVDLSDLELIPNLPATNTGD